MLEELVKSVCEEIIGAAFSGTFRKARSRKAQHLKAAAWFGMTSSIVLFIFAATLAQGKMVAVTISIGVLTTIVFIIFGIWAAVINAKIDHQGG